MRYLEKMSEKKILSGNNAKERAERSPEQQLEILDKRLGVGVGAVKERARLKKQIFNRGQKVTTATIILVDNGGTIKPISDEEKKAKKELKEKQKKERREAKVRKGEKK